MMPKDGVAKYQALVDGLVKRREGVLPLWIKEKGWPRLPENKKINALLRKLTRDQKETLASIARQARDGGIHDTLALLQEEMELRKLRLVVDGVELPVSPHDTEIFYDWQERADGKPWPTGLR